MAEQQSQNGQTVQPSQPVKQTEPSATREFIHVDTAQNSRLNKGQDENIYTTKTSE